MTPFRETLRANEFAITGELSLAPQQSIDDIVAQAAVAAKSADAIQIPDHRNSRPHISPVAIAARLLENQIEPVVRMNCRDRNRIAVQSELLSARSFGIKNLLLSRGSNFPEGHTPPSTEVHDLTAIDLVRTAAAIRDGEVMVEEKSDGKTDFFIGTVATAFKPKKEWLPEKLTAKADAGAQFIQLQVCMNMDVLSAYLAHLVDARLTWRFQVLANIPVLQSVDAARELRSTTTGSVIPSSLVGRLEQASDQEAEGVAIAAETLRLLKDVPGISGANLHTTGDPSLIAAAINESGLRPDVKS